MKGFIFDGNFSDCRPSLFGSVLGRFWVVLGGFGLVWVCFGWFGSVLGQFGHFWRVYCIIGGVHSANVIGCVEALSKNASIIGSVGTLSVVPT